MISEFSIHKRELNNLMCYFIYTKCWSNNLYFTVYHEHCTYNLIITQAFWLYLVSFSSFCRHPCIEKKTCVPARVVFIHNTRVVR